MGLDDAAALELAVRMAATGAVVVIVALVAERSGPAIGGVVAGLPMVLGPGFFFLLRQADAGFVSDAAAYSLLSLCATQVFLCAYIVAAGRLTPAAAICLAMAAWAAAAIIVRLLPPQPLIGILLFGTMTMGARMISSPFLASIASAPVPQGYAIMAWRAILAGSLVAVTTTAAGHLGAGWSGLVMAFPIGYLVVSFAVRAQLGVAGLTQVLHSALLGTTSLAAFCFALSLALRWFSSSVAFLTATCASVAITVLLLVTKRPRATRSRRAS